MFQRLKMGATLAAVVFGFGIFTPLSAQTAPAAAPAPLPTIFKQAPLPYSFDSLEPTIDKQTMELHHGRHHKAQYDALNRLTETNADLAKLTLEQLMPQISKFPPAVRNNAGGAWNHDFFWSIMIASDKRGAPSTALLLKMIADFGSVEAMKTAFNAAGNTRFGSGWAWLIVKDKKLMVVSTPNQDNPLMDVAEVRGTPILANDVWEHAYYLKYNNRRGEYLTNWWNVVNWNEVNRLFDAAMK